MHGQLLYLNAVRDKRVDLRNPSEGVVYKDDKTLEWEGQKNEAIGYIASTSAMERWKRNRPVLEHELMTLRNSRTVLGILRLISCYK